jgi:hypothetical protein
MKKILEKKFSKPVFKQYSSLYQDEYSYRGHRTRTSWKGVGPGDAFNSNLDYSERLQAQRSFYSMCKQAQKFAARLALGGLPKDFKLAIQPQLGPYYTNYPSGFAAFAAVGLTAFLEFKEWAGDKSLAVHLKEYLENPADHDEVWVDKAIYKTLAQNVTEKVQTRLLLTDLSRYKELSSIEIYRLFGASQQDLRFESVPEILEAVILYGDILPDWKDLNLHFVTKVFFRKLEEVSEKYFDSLTTVKAQELVALGRKWVIEICRALAPHLPPPNEKEEISKSVTTNRRLQEEYGTSEPRYSSRKKPPEMSDRILPLDEPKAPALFPPRSQIQQVLSDMLSAANAGTDDASKEPAGEESEKVKEIAEVLKQFNETLNQSCGQRQNWEDIRSEIVERTMKNASFSKGPIEGNPTDGHSVNVSLGRNQEASGEIYDRPVELSDNETAYQNLVNEAEPITRSLKHTLYPNVEQIAETQRICSGGTLDPTRMALSFFSEVIFKRYIIVEEPDKRGRPVLLIACDGSGSLNKHQMSMLKSMACAWLIATAMSRIEVLAALYHSGEYRKNQSGPLVQWMYHPQKTPAISRKDAARALVSLPDNGTGAQSDALSLAFMLEEAKKIARGRIVYLVLISDCAWNRSFNTEMNGQEEVYNYIQWAYEEFGDKLHTTLVALGVERETGFENLLDKVIRISQQELTDHVAVADRISSFVANCIKEQRRHNRRNRVA